MATNQSKMDLEKLHRIVNEFQIGHEITDFYELFIGHINPTYVVNVKENGKNVTYILQRVNNGVFKNVAGLMHNIEVTTAFIREKLKAEGKDPNRGTLELQHSNEGDVYILQDGEYWRVYNYIDGAKTYDSAENAEMFRKVGFAFGQFQQQLADFDASVLTETIPDFHDTPKRYETFEKTVEKNPASRAEEVCAEIAFVKARREKMDFIMAGIRDGSLPLRVTHNDTKLNNVMIDNETLTPVCVVDLDTVMPGCVLADFGDAIRFGASSAAEDEEDLSKVYVKLDMFEAFAEGFLEAVGDSLTEAEIRGLPMGAYLLTLECGMRFLTDYIDGDNYFHVRYPTHNLVRARNQFKLVADMEAKMDEMQAIIQRLTRKA